MMLRQALLSRCNRCQSFLRKLQTTAVPFVHVLEKTLWKGLGSRAIVLRTIFHGCTLRNSTANEVVYLSNTG